MKYSSLNTGMSTLLYVVPNLTRAIKFFDIKFYIKYKY